MPTEGALDEPDPQVVEAARRAYSDPDGVPADQPSRMEGREPLADLPANLREPVVLIDMFGMSYREVSVILRVPEGTVKSRVHRGRELLAAALRPEPEEGAGEV